MPTIFNTIVVSMKNKIRDIVVLLFLIDAKLKQMRLATKFSSVTFLQIYADFQ